MILVPNQFGWPARLWWIFCHQIPTMFLGFLAPRACQAPLPRAYAAGREDGLQGLQQVGSVVSSGGKRKTFKVEVS